MDRLTELALDPDKEFEVVDGQPAEKAMGGARHGGVGSGLLVRLGTHVEANALGAVYGPDTTYRIGTNDRLPDVSFTSRERYPEGGEPEGAWPMAPDLAVEIISPDDLYEKVIGKVEEYLSAGVRQVWLVSSEHRTATVFYSHTNIRVLAQSDELDGGDVVPGFRCRLDTLFRSPVHGG